MDGTKAAVRYSGRRATVDITNAVTGQFIATVLASPYRRTGRYYAKVKGGAGSGAFGATVLQAVNAAIVEERRVLLFLAGDFNVAPCTGMTLAEPRFSADAR